MLKQKNSFHQMQRIERYSQRQAAPQMLAPFSAIGGSFHPQ